MTAADLPLELLVGAGTVIAAVVGVAAATGKLAGWFGQQGR